MVQPFVRLSVGLYATKAYIKEHGHPDLFGDTSGHRFVCHDAAENRAPFNKWLRSHVAEDTITFRSSDARALEHAVMAGAGVGFLPVIEARANPNLVEIMDPSEDWSSPLWLVTHVDLHRTNKVQAFLSFLKDWSKDWKVL